MSFIDALQNATAQDLAEIDTRITALAGELAALRVAKRLLAEKFSLPADANGATPKPQRSSQGAKTAATRAARMTLAKYLSHAGTACEPVIVQAMELADGEFEHLTKSDWFVESAGGWMLTNNGRSAVAKAKG